ncbi:MAG: AzlC family ABC transporter permease [Anaeromyxobacteraceae bacterium]
MSPSAPTAPTAPRPASAGAEFLSGVRDLTPLLVGVAPFGLIYGVLALASGIPPVAAMAMSSIVFAGSAQFMLAQLFAVGAPALVMIGTVALVNLRHALYSASVAPHLAHLPRRWKAVLAYLLTDEAYAATVHRYVAGDRGPHAHWHALGAGLTLWGGWQVSTACGIALGAKLPSSVPLDFALPLTFIAITVPMIRSRAALAAAATAGAVALAAADLPYKLGLVAASLAGIAAGSLVAARAGRAGRTS